MVRSGVSSAVALVITQKEFESYLKLTEFSSNLRLLFCLYEDVEKMSYFLPVDVS